MKELAGSDLITCILQLLLFSPLTHLHGFIRLMLSIAAAETNVANGMQFGPDLIPGFPHFELHSARYDEIDFVVEPIGSMQLDSVVRTNHSSSPVTFNIRLAWTVSDATTHSLHGESKVSLVTSKWRKYEPLLTISR
jgi:hypothetical protein